MRALLPILFAILALIPQPSKAQTMRALFVGVDSYQYSSDNENKEAAFRDLKGAVADAERFKNALHLVYKLEVDSATAGACRSSNSISTTLFNTCATRDAILLELDKLIDASAAGDTLIFYFAGHGSQFADDTKFTQASGRNSTILPTDARQPSAMIDGDIFDYELKAKKDRATAKGVYFVSIFDSCNSGTATRDGASGQSRSVPMLTGKPPARPLPPAPPATSAPGGYWVHIAAAQDGEQAQEVGEIGKREGVFTTALIDTLSIPSMRYATFGDIIREVQARVAARGHISQNPMAEGSLKASLGSGARKAVTFEVKADAGGLTMRAGKLSGMTSGSEFALYASEADAFTSGAKPLAVARITDVQDYAAKLVVDGNSAGLPSKIIALETRHAFGDAALHVANHVTSDVDRKLVQSALDALPFIDKSGNAQVQIGIDPQQPRHAQLLASDGIKIGDLGLISDIKFADRLTKSLKKILRVQQLLALRTDGAQAGVRFCIDDSKYGAKASECPPPERANMRVLKANAGSFVTVENTAAEARFVYVFGIDPAYGVALIMPPPGANDPKLQPRYPHRIPDDPVVPTVTGTYRFVTIASAEPINAAALEQDGTNSRGASGCITALERLLCSAKTGTRDASAPKVGSWTAIVESVVVE